MLLVIYLLIGYGLALFVASNAYRARAVDPLLIALIGFLSLTIAWLPALALYYLADQLDAHGVRPRWLRGFLA